VFGFIDQWNGTAHPFKWSPASFDKVLRRAEGWRSNERHWTDDLKAAAWWSPTCGELYLVSGHPGQHD
jgi:hypothetical protein